MQTLHPSKKKKFLNILVIICHLFKHQIFKHVTERTMGFITGRTLSLKILQLFNKRIHIGTINKYRHAMGIDDFFSL